MKVKLLKLLRSKFNFEHNHHIWFADYKYTDGINCNVKTRSIIAINIRLLIKKHNEYIGLTKYQLKKLRIYEPN